MNQGEQNFSAFLNNFIPHVAREEKRVNTVWWRLATVGDAGSQEEYVKAMADYRLLFTDHANYDRLVNFQNSGTITNPLLVRQLERLILSFRGNMLPPDLIQQLATQDAELEKTFGSFRPKLNGKSVTDNEIAESFRTVNDVSMRKQTWESSKQVGVVMAPLIRKAVKLRNESAHILGYPNYFEMAYRLDELNPGTVLSVFDDLAFNSEQQWKRLQVEISNKLAKRFDVSPDQLGPWAWADPFSQHDPLENSIILNPLFKGQDVVAAAAMFYESIGMDVGGVISRSDLYERTGKNPHAFCIHMDRGGDVRVLANVKPQFYWFSTMMHELGHAVYDMFINPDLPWLLRCPAHTLTTEAMAIMVQKYAQHAQTLKKLFGFGSDADGLLEELERGYARDQLVFSRWANVVVRFEKTMYEDPDQDLQAVWWSLVQKYQGITPPTGRKNASDWAAKVHIGTAPCYYQNYMLGYLFSAQIDAVLTKMIGDASILGHKVAGDFLRKNLFAHGSCYRWDRLVTLVTGKPLGSEDWVSTLHSI